VSHCYKGKKVPEFSRPGSDRTMRTMPESGQWAEAPTFRRLGNTRIAGTKPASITTVPVHKPGQA